MSANPRVALRAIDGGRTLPFLETLALRRLCHAFDALPHGEVEVLEDREDAVTRYLCRGSRRSFPRPETFAAAAVRRYLGCVSDPRLAEMMFVDALTADHLGEAMPCTALRSWLAARERAAPPSGWLARLGSEGAQDLVLLDARSARLELVARGPQCWLYGLLEG